ncbi:MAG: 8-oxo-dGTP diphosphatase [Lachnospiraceae bacterium]|nr:8-oxo-dGTP diphosphatase [Lachnospiraceae bacterium]
MEIEITTMCAVVNEGKVLMINRKRNWKGWAFLGGHLEAGESVEMCVKREIYEEAGIQIRAPRFVGITNIYNPELLKRHIIFNYVTSSFEGCLKEQCEEGEISWINIDSIEMQQLAEGMEYRLPLFFTNKYSELYIEWKEDCGYTKVEYI